MPLNRMVEQAVRRVRARIDRELPGLLVEMRVFGSEARGEATEDSDVDLFIMVDHRNSEVDNAIFRIIYDVYMELNFEPFMVPLIMSREQFSDLLARERRLARDIVREGIPV